MPYSQESQIQMVIAAYKNKNFIQIQRLQQYLVYLKLPFLISLKELNHSQEHMPMTIN